MMAELPVFLIRFLEIAVLLFVFAIGVLILLIGVLYIIDKSQRTHAIRHNFPVIGRFRYYFEDLGEFFRQYFFAMDREELPFNRAERSWAYRAAKISITPLLLVQRGTCIQPEPYCS